MRGKREKKDRRAKVWSYASGQLLDSRVDELLTEEEGMRRQGVEKNDRAYEAKATLVQQRLRRGPRVEFDGRSVFIESGLSAATVGSTQEVLATCLDATTAGQYTQSLLRCAR